MVDRLSTPLGERRRPARRGLRPPFANPGIGKVFRLWAQYARMDWQLLSRDARTGLIYILSDLVSATASVLGIALLAVRFEGIGELSADEILWMLGFFSLADGATLMMLGGCNFLFFSRISGRGQVDHMLMQPCPMWMQLLTGGFLPFTGSSGFLAGLALTVYATARLGIAVTPGWVLLLIAYVIARIATALGVGLISGAAAFYRPVSCEELSTVVLDALSAAGKYPLATLPIWLQGLFFTALPVGLMAYLPSLLMLKKLRAPLAYVWPVAAGAAFMSLAGLLFRKGLKHYAKNGCPRYKGMGFRS